MHMVWHGDKYKITFKLVISWTNIVGVFTDWLDNEETGNGVKGSSPCCSREVYGLTAAFTVPYPGESMDARLLCSI
jgi:hypothetical protein